MKRLIAIVIVFIIFSCKKQNSDQWITATVIQKGCHPDSWMIQIDNPDRAKEPFLCDRTEAMLSSTYPNCGNAAVILNLSPILSQPGTKIKFSQ